MFYGILGASEIFTGLSNGQETWLETVALLLAEDATSDGIGDGVNDRFESDVLQFML